MADETIPPFKANKPKRKPKRVVTVYLLDTLKAKLDAAAVKADRSFSAEVNHRLGKSFGRADD